MKKRSIKLLALLMTCTLAVTPMTAFASETQATDVTVSETANVETNVLDPVGSSGLVVKPAEDIVYTGEAVDTAKLSVTKDGEDLTEEDGKPSYEFYANSEDTKGDKLDTAPVDAGKYWVVATLTVENETITSDAALFEIKKAEYQEVTITKKDSVDWDNLIYTKEDMKATLENGLEVTADGKTDFDGVDFEFSIKDGDKVTEVTDAGDYTVKATVNGGTNYNNKQSDNTVEFTIKQATASIEFKAASYMAKLTEKDVSVESDAESVEFTYYSDKGCENTVEESNLAVDTDYYVKASVAETTNYTKAETTEPAMVRFAANYLADDETTYDGTTKSTTSKVKESSLPDAATLEVDGSTIKSIDYKYFSDAECTTETEVDPENVINAGTYYVKAIITKLDEEQNETTVESNRATFTVKKAASEIAINAKEGKELSNIPYTGTAIAIEDLIDVTKTENSTGAVSYEIMYNSGADGTKDEAVTEIRKAGIYTVKAKLEADNNYKDAESEPITITVKAVIAPVKEIFEFTYTGKPIALTGADFVLTEDGKAPADSTLAYNYYTKEDCAEANKLASAPSDAGVYYIQIAYTAPVPSEDETESVDSTGAEAEPTAVIVVKAVINQATPTVTLANKAVTYNGQAQAIGAASVTGSNGAITYKYYSDAACKKEIAAANVKNAGTYYALASVAATKNYTEASSKAATLTINKANSSITLANKTVTYNGKAQTIGAASVTGSNGAITYKYYSDAACKKEVAAANVKNAGTYYVKATVAANANYNAATSAAAKLTVNKAASTVTLANKTVTATGKKIAMTGAKATGSKGKISYKYYSDKNCKKAVSAAKVKKAGTYYVKATVAADTNYKSATSKAAKLVIKPAQTITCKKATVTYKASALKSKKKTFKIGATSKQKGKITYTKASNKKKTLSVSKTGTVTVKKGLKKGTYTLNVKITAAAKGKYGKTTVTKTIKVKVK